MTTHQTIVVELGSSRIKVGFAGEPRPRKVLNDSGSGDAGTGAGWSVGVSDSMVSRACSWSSFFQYLSSDGPEAPAVKSVYEWEKALYPLFSHILISVLYIQRPSRHRMLLLSNDAFPPRHFREALHRVLLEYLSVGGVWLANGGTFESVHYLLEGMPPSVPSIGRPKAHMLVDIGTYEARVVVSVAGSSTLLDTQQTTMSGYNSFLRQVLSNYQDTSAGGDGSEQSSGAVSKSPVSTLEDANAVVQAWVAISSCSPDSPSDSTKILVNLPSQQLQAAKTETQLSTQPLLEAFHQIYLDYTNPSSLIFAMLSCAMTCPIDYRKVVLQNVKMLGGGSVALRNFGFSKGSAVQKNPATCFGMQLELAARDACGLSEAALMEEGKEEEKKEDISSISKHRFQSLRGIVAGHVSDSGETIGGISVQYMDPFASDLSAWIGGSIMGTLGYTNYQKKI